MTVATTITPGERVVERRREGLDEPWLVVVLNDDHNTFEGVAFALSAVLPGVDYDEGLRLADGIHFTGRAIVWSGHQELAELYWSQLDACGLTLAPLGS